MKYRMRKIAAACLFSFISSYAWSVPAKPGLIVYQQPDGTEIAVRLVGDEFNHYYLSEDGHLLLPDQSNRLCYAYLEENGKVQISALQANNLELRTDNERIFLNKQNQQEVLLHYLNSTNPAAQVRRAAAERGMRNSNPYPTTGKQKVLVILAEFSDVKFATPNAKASFNRMLNEEGYSENGATGSARDYYMASSNGQYEPEIDVYGPVALSHDMDYYGANTGGGGQDVRPWTMIADACAALDGEVDFSKYDLDKDGFVDNVYLFYAGYGEADGGPSTSVWPHSFNLYPLVNLKLDNVQVDRYACSNELVYDTDKMVGIGTFCHEFGHVLGLPDIYSTNYTNNVHPGNWDVMSGGNYLNNGNTPPLMSAYERYFLDWLEPTELNVTDTTVVLPNLRENKAYRISTGKKDEYFLLENRQQTGWDQFVPGHGMLVWHIDYNQEQWDLNTVNDNASHQYIDIEEADNVAVGTDKAGNTFPGKKNVSSMTNTTRPNLKSWSGADSKVVLFNIHETADSLIVFDAVSPSGSFQAPVVTEATNITPVSFQANWQAVDGAVSYAIEVYTQINTVSGMQEVMVAGFSGRPVGKMLSCEVTGLQPETEYFYRVRARNEKFMGANSQPMKVMTGDKDYRFFYPETADPTEITSNSFVANWKELAESEKYYISLVAVERGESEVELCDFAKGAKVPDGWNTNVYAATDKKGYYGKESPALNISKNKGLVTSPVKKNPVGKLSFWYRGYEHLDESSSLNVYGFDEFQNWKVIQVIDPITKEEGGATFTLDFETLDKPYYAIGIELNRPISGSMALDDIEVSHMTTVVNNVAGYQDLEVGNTLSVAINNLKPNTKYGYQVKGFNGEFYSKYSPICYLQTLPDETSIDAADAASALYAYVADGKLVVCGLTAADAVSVYDVSGRLVAHRQATGESMNLPLQTEGMYLIRVGEKTLKVVR